MCRVVSYHSPRWCFTAYIFYSLFTHDSRPLTASEQSVLNFTVAAPKAKDVFLFTDACQNADDKRASLRERR